MKALLFLIIFSVCQQALASEVSKNYLSERHKFICGFDKNFMKLKTRTCSYQVIEEDSVEDLSGNISSALSHYKDDILGMQCRTSNKKKWDKIFYEDKSFSSLLPSDQECACGLKSRKVKRFLCGDKSIDSKLENIKKMSMQMFKKEIETRYKVSSIKSILFPTSSNRCEIKEQEGCSFKIETTEIELSDYISRFGSYIDKANNEIKEKAWVNSAIDELRAEIRKSGDIQKVLDSYNLNKRRITSICFNKQFGDRISQALAANKYIYDRICLNGDIDGFISALESSSKDDKALEKSFEEYLNADQKDSFTKSCNQVKAAAKLYCDIETGKLSFLDYATIHPEEMSKAGLLIPSYVNRAIRCTHKKGDDLKFNSLGKVIDHHLKDTNFLVDMNGPGDKIRNKNDKEVIPIGPRDKIKADSLPRLKPRPSNKKNKESGSLVSAEIASSPITNDIEVFKSSGVTEEVIPLEKKLALNSFAATREDVENDKTNGTLTEEKKQEYREIETQYKEMLGRDVDIFTTDARSLKKDIIVEEGTKQYRKVANRASELSNEIQTLTQQAVTAGPRERFRIQGRLKKISNELNGFKKYGFNFRVKVPTISQILNVGRGDSHDQLSSFTAIENSQGSSPVVRPARDLEVNDYSSEQTTSSFPSYKVPLGDLGPAQDFSKNFTTGPTKLLPEKSYSKNEKKNVKPRSVAAQSSRGTGARRGPASSGGRSSGGVSSGGSLGLSGGGSSTGAAYNNTRTYQVENKSYEPKILNNAEKPATKVVFVEDLKVMRVFKLNDEKVYEIDAEYTEDSFKENYSQFEEEVKLDGEQFFRYRVKDMERMLRNK